MIGLLGRVGGVLLAPRALLGSLPEGTGRSDGAALLLAYLLAVGLPGIAAAVADLIALGPLAGLSGLAQGLLPLLPWLLTASAVEWRLGDARAHRAGLCLCPLLVLAALAHLAALCGLELPGPGYLPALLGVSPRSSSPAPSAARSSRARWRTSCPFRQARASCPPGQASPTSRLFGQARASCPPGQLLPTAPPWRPCWA